MAKYYVTKIEKCDRCKGNGWIESQEWKEYFELKSQKKPALTPTYPEERVCPNCEGDGKIESQINLIDALIAIRFLDIVY